jgi:hypothetical protein
MTDFVTDQPQCAVLVHLNNFTDGGNEVYIVRFYFIYFKAGLLTHTEEDADIKNYNITVVNLLTEIENTFQSKKIHLHQQNRE